MANRDMDWSRETTLAFIELYESLPVLWDPKHLGHKHRASINEAWEEIQRKLDESISIIDLKRKKESLMTSYRLLRKKVVESEKQGYVYKPSWFAYDAIDKFLSFRVEIKTNYSQEDSWITEAQEEEVQNTEELPEGEYILAHEVKCFSANPQPESNTRLVESTPQKRRLDVSSANDAFLTSSLKKACNALTALSSRQPQVQDQCLIFGQLIVEQLRQLSPRNRIVTQNKLFAILGEALLEELE